jgi:hypothetical protein
MRIFIISILALFSVINIKSQNLLNGPDDIVFDAKYNRYLIGNWAGNIIVALDSNGNQTVFKTNLPYCHGMELYGDTLYTASADKIFGININDAQIIKNITVPGSARLGHITLDTLNNILYVSDWNVKKIFKVNINTNTPGVLVNSGIETPGGVLFDYNYNRIILLTFEANTPIKAVNPSSGQVTNITSAGYDHLDAIAKDKYGYIYVSSFTQGLVYRFDSVFSASPELISSGHNGPSGFGYNSRDHILGVTNYNTNSYSLITLPVISVKNISGNAESFVLFQNYPNPFNPSTKIKFSVPPSKEARGMIARLCIYDILGREVALLVYKRLNPGTYEVEWNASGFASGVYFYKLVTDKYVSIKKMCLLK